MLFNSLQYLWFLPVVFSLYYIIPHKFRWVLLLLASYYFYGCWKVEYLLLIIFSTIIDYYSAIEIAKSVSRNRKKLFLGLSLFVNLGMLVGFKYLNFISTNLNDLFNFFNSNTEIPYYNIILPVGISFYTFQTLSYTIDVYNGKMKPQKHFGKFAVFVSFFPQLVAGPIERAVNLVPQFNKKITFNYYNAVSGLRRILWGLFKKTVVADRSAIIVNYVYDSPGDHNGFTLLIASYLFAFQIYCDFSGYSDIAIGSARILGFNLMENFKTPYFSKSISEFWSRWHISLSTWFRDYVYIPLGGSVASKARILLNIMIVFVLSGIWHGANWTFVCWGALHGALLILERLTGLDSRKKTNLSFWKNAFRVIIYFNIVVLGWIYFRSNSVSDAHLIISEIFTFQNWGFDLSHLNKTTSNLSLNKFITTIFFCGFLLAAEYIIYHTNYAKYLFKQNRLVSWTVFFLLISAIIMLGNHGNFDFIYFQF